MGTVRQLSEAQQDTLRRNQIQPGEVRNKQGVNGWTKLRERARVGIDGSLEDVLDKMLELAAKGDVQAARLAGDLMIERVDGARDQRLHRLAALPGQIIRRVEALGQRENFQINLLGDEQFEHFVGPLAADLVAVEQQIALAVEFTTE